MANTFKFGNGEWARKTGRVLAYNSENDNYKPLPFTFDRASSATRFNKEGLIETVDVDEPRIDFLNNSKGHLLLEPQSTNLVPYSEDFSQWTLQSGTTVTSNTTETLSPSGEYNASKIVGNGTNGLFKSSVDTGGGTNTKSIYIKGTQSGQVVYLKDPNQTVNNKALTLTTDWQRYTLTESQTGAFGIWINTIPTSGIYLWGGQVEQLSYATSYIPTSGSAVTRSAESCNQIPPSGVIGQTEGTIFLDADLYKKTDTEFYIAISDASLSNSIYLHQVSESLIVNKRISGATQSSVVVSANWSSGRNKCAIKYTANEMKIFINGVLKDTESISGLPSGLSNITIGSRQDNLGQLSSNSNYREAKLYNTALTDAELISLTS